MKTLKKSGNFSGNSNSDSDEEEQAMPSINIPDEQEQATPNINITNEQEHATPSSTHLMSRSRPRPMVFLFQSIHTLHC
jgi:hypothetical protein